MVSAKPVDLPPLGYLSILLATAAGWLVFGDRPGPSLAPGGVVVILGVLIVQRADRPTARPAICRQDD